MAGRVYITSRRCVGLQKIVSTHMVFMGLRLPAILAAAVCVAGCSLVSLKTPERPLSNRDLNARILTREFSYHFIAAVGQCADDMGAGETDPEVLTRALRWKIAAATESQRAASRISPMMSLLDTWALTAQMRAFLSPGQAGGELFGSHQETAVALAGELDKEAQALARRLTCTRPSARFAAACSMCSSGSTPRRPG